jgi:hypothetical protein
MPACQADILRVARSYGMGARHRAGLRFAINTDPAQFGIHAGPATGRCVLTPAWSRGVIDDRFSSHINRYHIQHK